MRQLSLEVDFCEAIMELEVRHRSELCMLELVDTMKQMPSNSGERLYRE